MVIRVANNYYKVTRSEARKLLQVASDLVPNGIYAVEKKDKGYMELVNLPMSPEGIKKTVKEYGQQGWKVYANVKRV